MDYAADVSITGISILVAFAGYFLSIMSLTHLFYFLFRGQYHKNKTSTIQAATSTVFYAIPFLMCSYRVFELSHYGLIALLVSAIVLLFFMLQYRYKVPESQGLSIVYIAVLGVALASLSFAVCLMLMFSGSDSSLEFKGNGIIRGIVLMISTFVALPVNLVSLVLLAGKYSKSLLCLYPIAMLIFLLMPFFML